MRSFRVLAVLVALLLPLLPAARAAADEPTATITGTQQAGRWVSAVVAGADAETIYEWLVDGVPTPSTHPFDPSQPSPWLDRFFLREEHLGSQVAVNAHLATGQTVSSEAFVVQTGTILANPPVIEGVYRVGDVLTAKHNVLYPTADATIAYQWFYYYNVPIEGATGPALTLGPELLGKSGIYVEVSASKPGWRPSKLRSERNSFSVTPRDIQPGTIYISNHVALGRARVQEDAWPSGESVETTYQWLLDGRELSGQTAEELFVDLSWVGRKLSVRATKTRIDGTSTVTVTSPQVVVAAAALEQVTYGRFDGRQAVVGWPLAYFPGSWTQQTSEKYQWIRIDQTGRETPIPGETGTRYRVGNADIGFQVGIRVTTSAPGHETRSTTYAPTNRTILNVYTTPGDHTVGGREWRTTCEPYSQTLRCRTEIIATQVLRVNGRYTRVTGWTFNNLTYMPLSWGDWGSNPLARDSEWTDGDGRQWRTDCDRGTCRTYIHAFVPTGHKVGGLWRYSGSMEWVFNNQVYVR